MRKLPSFLVLISLLSSLLAREQLDLSGTWKVELDRTDAGLSAKWFSRELQGQIALPGSIQRAGLGDKPGVQTQWTGGIIDKSYFTAPEYEDYRRPDNIKVPFWLQPETHYTGVAWYQRVFTVPASWKGKQLTIHLERPHWKTALWLDDLPLGNCDTSSVEHVYVLPQDLSPGEHRLSLRVDNRMDPDIGENSHSISDHTQGNWNGVVGRLELHCNEPVWIDSLVVDAKLQKRSAFVTGRLAKLATETWPSTITLSAPTNAVPPCSVPIAKDGSFSAELFYGDEAKPWDEFNPALHQLKASLPNGETRLLKFGFRKIESRDNQLLINGRPLFLRGTLDCAIFPRTGHPAMEHDEWRGIFATIKRHGLNHVRFHSWCPPTAAFEVADELGLYLQIEVASWPNQSTTLGDGAPVDEWLERETQRILQAYGNHPSFLFLAAGNEPGGKKHAAWLTAWLARHKAADARRLYTGGSGWPELANNDYHVTPDPRIQAWGAGLKSRINAHPPETRTDYSDFINNRTVPVVSHEIGQWCVYPNFAEMPKYSGYLKPRNFEIFRTSLEKNGMLAQAPDFLKASGKLQALCYKEDIESALRTRHMGGFQLLGLQDFPGQGTALVGMLDAFWEEKGYITPEEFRRFCSPTVPLARLDKRVFIEGEHLACDVELSHFGPVPLLAQTAIWRLQDANGVGVAEGRFQTRDIPVGAGCPLGHLDISLSGLRAPAKYKLIVSLPGTNALNDWDLWVYPKPEYLQTRIPAGVHVTGKLDAAAEARLREGGTVWLMLDKSQVKGDARRGPIALGFSSIFWNTAWTEGQAPHTLGILCNPAHPALAGFPTEMHSNWQWWYPMTQAAPILLDDMPHALQPIVQVIDDWVTNRKLALVFEARVAGGKLLVSSIGLNDISLDPVRRQLRASLLGYIRSENFKPATELSIEQINSLLATKASK